MIEVNQSSFIFTSTENIKLIQLIWIGLIETS